MVESEPVGVPARSIDTFAAEETLVGKLGGDK